MSSPRGAPRVAGATLQGPMSRRRMIVAARARGRRYRSSEHEESRRLFAEDGHATHQTPLVGAELGSCMQRATVIPHQEVTGTPDVLVDEFAPLLVIEQRGEQLVALLRGQPFDPHR